MTTYQKVLKLLFTHEEATRYMPPPGMEIAWSEWNPKDKTVVAQFTVSDDMSVFWQERKNLEDIEIELANHFKNRVLFDYTNNKMVQKMLKLPHQQVKDAHRTDVLLDDAIMDQMPKGTKGKITDQHYEIKSTKDVNDANDLLQGKVGTDKKLYPDGKSDSGKFSYFRVGRIKKSEDNL